MDEIGTLYLPSVCNKSAKVGESFLTTLPAATGGQAPYKYKASGLPAGLSFTASTRKVSGTPTTAGSSSVTYTATDSASTSTQRTFLITVAEDNENQAPVTTTTITDKNIAVGGSVKIGLSSKFRDPDGDSLN